MIEEFLRQSTPGELFTYGSIIVVLFGLSPYGVFLARCVIAWRRGTAPPRLVRRDRRSPERQVKDFADQAVSKITELEAYIAEMRYALDAAEIDVARLESENEALREHIRGMGAAQDESGPEGSWEEATPREDDWSLFGLDETASFQDLKHAYRDAVRQNHPDHGGDTEALQRINAAYERLKQRFK
jgi:hypothetical protein